MDYNTAVRVLNQLYTDRISHIFYGGFTITVAQQKNKWNISTKVFICSEEEAAHLLSGIQITEKWRLEQMKCSLQYHGGAIHLSLDITPTIKYLTLKELFARYVELARFWREAITAHSPFLAIG